MQRRAVAVFVALFLAVAGVAGALTATADSPEIAFENPEVDAADGDTVQIGGESYAVGVSESEEGGGGHGGAATTVVTGTLEADDSADNQTVTSDDGEEFVLVTDESGETTSVPADEYFPEPERRSYAPGDTLQYDGNTVTVDDVAADGAVVVWETTQTETIEIEQHSMVTVGGTEYVAHFPDASTLQLTTDAEAYESQASEMEQFSQYNSGLSRVLILSVLSSIMLAGMAFMPSRY